jgi:hypothetical protein
MPQDWFAQNAPKSSSGDWFSQNAPKGITDAQRNFAPGVPKLGLPEEKPEFQGMDYGSELPIPSDNFATSGARKMADGAAKMTRPGVSPKLGGVSDIMRGGAEIGAPAAAAVLPFAAVAAPVATALGIAGGVAGGKAARSGAKALGADEDVQNFAEDAGGAVGGTLASMAPRGAVKAYNAISGRNVRNVNNPVEEAALASVEKSVRMTPGQRAGQRGLQNAERDLVNKPGTANRAEDFYHGQQDDLAAEGRRIVASQPGTGAGTAIPSTNAYGAGESVQEALGARIKSLKSYADKLYDSTRQTTARNKKLVPGKPATKWEYDPETGYDAPLEYSALTPMETPVDLAPIRTRLRPVYDELKRSLPDARKANSPAWQSLEDLMSSGDSHLNAMDFDRTLGAVKAISRNGDSPLLSTQSQRLAKQVISAGESEFQKAMQGAGPNVVDKLSRARKAVAEYHNTAEFLGDLADEPAALYSSLTTGGDRVRDALGHLNRTAPQALRTVGKTYLESMMDKATREGGFGRSAGVAADWAKVGPETKKLIFGPQLTSRLDNFLLAAKKLTPHPGSPTADRLSAITSYGDVGLALGEFLAGSMAGHPAVGAAGAGLTLLKTRVQPAILAELSFKPAGSALLKQAITLPPKSPAFDRVMQQLNAMLINQNTRPDPLGLFGEGDNQ